MQWFKTWLRKWLGVEDVRDETVGLVHGQFSALETRLGLRIENVRESHVSVKEMGDACMARLDRETMKLATAIDNDRTGTRELFDRVRADILDVVKTNERGRERISELEILVKDATIDTALAELEDRVAKLESTPAPAAGPQGRRGGASWNSHQVAAGQGAALANGSPVPIPTPGIS